MKPWLTLLGAVIVAIAVWQLLTIVVAHKWAIVLAILAFGIGLVGWMIHRDSKRGEPRR